MRSLRSSLRLQCVCFKHLRNIESIHCSWKNYCAVHSFIKEVDLVAKTYRLFSKSSTNLYSTSTVSLSSNCKELVDSNIFEKVCEETLESLTEFFEEVVDRKDNLKNADVSYSGGVLTINLGHYGTYVINRQSPNKQIWLSSPISGPKRYDYVVSGKYWVYKHDMVPLHKLLESEISNILGEKIDFSTCLYSKT